MKLVFDGLNLANFSLPHVTVPDVKNFLESLKRSTRTQETYAAFLGDNTNYFEACAVEESLLMNVLMTDPHFLAEFEAYQRETKRVGMENLRMGFLMPRIDESVIASKIRELENLRFSLQERVESQQRVLLSLALFRIQSASGSGVLINRTLCQRHRDDERFTGQISFNLARCLLN